MEKIYLADLIDIKEYLYELASSYKGLIKKCDDLYAVIKGNELKRLGIFYDKMCERCENLINLIDTILNCKDKNQLTNLNNKFIVDFTILLKYNEKLNGIETPTDYTMS